MSSQTDQKAPLYPWYDDRVEDLRQTCADPVAETVEEPTWYTPKEIYDYLDRHVWKQTEAKKAASVILYNALHSIRSTAMFIGPTGCGKSHLWRCLQKIYPNRIVIADSSGVSKEGWAGSTKWKDLLRSPIFRSGNHSILVCDEFDKTCSPKFTSGGNNASFGVQGEALTLVEGTHVDVKINSVIHSIDTSKISFVFCGAFSNKAHDIAEKSSGARIGFGAAPEPVQPYAHPLSINDLINFGLMPEFAGRIQRIVNLQPPTVEDFYWMTSDVGPVLRHIRQQYGADVRLTPEKRRELAEMAYRTGLGVRGIQNQIMQLLDFARFDECTRQCFEF